MIRKGDKIGPYTLLEKLGRGGFGVVWLAEKRSALAVTQVALKMPNDDDIDLDAVRREAALWIQASGHPNVLSFIDADIYDEQVVIVSEYAPDGSLATWVKNHGNKAPSVSDAIEMASGILSGLAHLHSRKIIHRDLKPANILLQGSTPRLVDFGLARVMKTTSHSRTVSGTYAYMPPETFEGGRSEQTDIWSAGVILYEMLVGHLPYPQDNDAALIGAILHGKPEPLPEQLSKSLRAVIERAMEKDLDKRFKTALEMRTALHDISLILQTGESSAAKTVVLHSLSEENLSGEKVTTPIPTLEIEDSPYKTKAMEKPLTESSPSIDKSVEIEERKTFEPLQTETSPTVIAQAQTWQENQSAKKTEELSEPIESRENIKPHITTTVSREKSFETPKDTKDKSKTGLWVGIGAFVFVGVFVLAIGGYILSGFIGNSNSRNSSPDGKQSETAKDNKDNKAEQTINPTGRELGVLQAKGSVYEVAISADGKLAASVGDDSLVRLWRNEESKMPMTLNGHTDIVRSVSISPDGQTIASVSDDKTIRLWSLKNDEAFTLKQKDDSTQSSSSFMAKQDIVPTQGPVSKPRQPKRRKPIGRDVIYPNKNKNKNQRTEPTTDSPSKKTTSNETSTDAGTGVLLRELKGHNDYVFSVLFSKDGQTIVSASGDKTIRFWNVSEGSLKQTFEMPDKSELIVSISPDLRLVAFYLESSKRVRVWSLTENRLISELQGEKFEVRGGAFSPDSNTLALGSKDGAVRLYRVNDGARTKLLQGVNKETGRVIYNSTGELLAAGYSDGSICLWNADDGRLLKTLKGHTKFVFALAFSADNRVLASGSEDQTLRLWEIVSK